MSKTQIISLVGIGTILGVITLSQFALLTHTWNPSWNPYKPSPETIFLQTLRALQETKTLQTHTRIQASVFDAQGNDTFQVGLTYTGQSDTSNPDYRNEQGMLEGTIRFEGLQLSMAAEYRSVEGVTYINITELPLLSYLQLFIGEDVGSIQNQWIAIHPEEIATLQDFTQTPQEKQFQEDFKQEITRMLTHGELLSDIKRVGQETVNDTQTHHLTITLQKAGLEHLLAFISTSDEQFEGIYTKDVQLFFEQLSHTPIHLWVHTANFLPQRILFTGEFSDISSQQNFTETIHLEIQGDFSKFNEPVTVSAPEDSQNFQEIIERILGENLEDILTSETEISL